MSISSRKAQALIAIITQQRSGSKWVGSLIRERYGAVSLGEIFNPDDRSILSFRSYVARRSLDDVIGSDISSILDSYFEELRMYLGLFYSFDAMFNQMDWINFGWRPPQNALYSYLMSRGDIIVSLVRNIKDVFISMKALDVTKKAHYTDMESGCNGINQFVNTIYLDYHEYLKFREKAFFDRYNLRECFKHYPNYIEINYEKVRRDPMILFRSLDSSLRNFGNRIGYDFPAEISPFPALIKSPHDYSKLVANYDEVLCWPD